MVAARRHAVSAQSGRASSEVSPRSSSSSSSSSRTASKATRAPAAASTKRSKTDSARRSTAAAATPSPKSPVQQRPSPPEPQPPALRTYDYPYGECAAHGTGTDRRAVKLVSFNVTSLRALLRKSSALDDYIARERPDVLALQETKLSEPVPRFDEHAPGYDKHFHCSRAKKGYSGTAVYVRRGSALGVPRSVRHGFDDAVGARDDEGRVIIVEFDALTLVNIYVPNSGAALARLGFRTDVWDAAVRRQLQLLRDRSDARAGKNGGGGGGCGESGARGDDSVRRPVVLAGDLNCAHDEIDIWNPAGNRRSAGFTDEERGSFTRTLRECGLTDSFRHCHPGVRAYTYWSQRHVQNYSLNRGWRLDYFLVDARARVLDSFMRLDADSFAPGRMSDHVPIVLVVEVR